MTPQPTVRADRWNVIWLVVKVFVVVSFVGYMVVSQYQIEQLGEGNHQIVRSLTCDQPPSVKLTDLPPLCRSLDIAESLAIFVAGVEKTQGKPDPQVTQIDSYLKAICVAVGLQPNCKPEP